MQLYPGAPGMDAEANLNFVHELESASIFLVLGDDMKLWCLDFIVTEGEVLDPFAIMRTTGMHALQEGVQHPLSI